MDIEKCKNCKFAKWSDDGSGLYCTESGNLKGFLYRMAQNIENCQKFAGGKAKGTENREKYLDGYKRYEFKQCGKESYRVFLDSRTGKFTVEIVGLMSVRDVTHCMFYTNGMCAPSIYCVRLYGEKGALCNIHSNYWEVLQDIGKMIPCIGDGIEFGDKMSFRR